MTVTVYAKRLPVGTVHPGGLVSTICRPVEGFILGTSDRYQHDPDYPVESLEPRLRALGDSLLRPDNAQTASGPWLVYAGNESEAVTPLSEPALHRRFANLGSPQSMLRFATRYGGLGNLVALVDSENPESVVVGEAVDEWLREVSAVFALTKVYEMVLAGDENGLKKVIRWVNGSVVSEITVYRDQTNLMFDLNPWLRDIRRRREIPDYLSGADFFAGGVTVAAKNNDTQLFKFWKEGEVVRPAIHLLTEEVKRRLRNSFSFGLLLFVKETGISRFPLPGQRSGINF